MLPATELIALILGYAIRSLPKTLASIRTHSLIFPNTHVLVQKKKKKTVLLFLLVGGFHPVHKLRERSPAAA